MQSLRFFCTPLVLVLVLIARAAHGIIYQCDHYESEKYEVRYCALFNVTIVHFAEDVDFVSDYPRPYRFEFFQSNLTEVPRALFVAFPEMQEISFEATGLENINRYTFEHAKQLQRLSVSGNGLTSLGNLVFMGAERLLSLNASHNRLKEVKEQAFGGLPGVTELDLSHNLLESLADDLFASLKALTVLLLHHNRLTVLGREVLRENYLTSLDLSHNRLTALDPGALGLGVIGTLSVRGNQLRSFTLPAETMVVDVSDNNLTTIGHPAGHAYTVRHLNISHNRLASIVNVTDLTQLVSLDASFNELGALPLTTFLSLRSLVVLNLEATNLTHLEYGLFSQQTALSWLDVSFNRLRTFDVSVLTAAPDLQQLFLDGNRLTDLDYAQLGDLFPVLKHLGLFANHWNCSYLIELMRYCKRHGISIEPSKAYGTVLHLPNVRGIYCQSSAAARLPLFRPVLHSVNETEEPQDPPEAPTTVRATGIADQQQQLLEMIHQLNRTTWERMDRMAEAKDRESGSASGSGSEALHAYSFQVFILLILSVILIINVGFLLWVQHNANVRRAVDRMIIFRREQGASIQTELHGEF
ncbi:insulin-like growth factor-binding protein complex acid labile subunit [Anopheles bellator]|uniref:insulin-like growth factor-binding protein complex acid labile subunit n=1 Tax=Anopheles bellator TaxID=139047 RepID=UPI002648F035|nr:insulin-like growth factor-binding protein complex acid labile subunit [Anopheles bellator]